MDPYYSSLSESSVHHVLARSEASAALMADGYARASRNVGIVDGVGGPGAAYIGAGLCEAEGASSPVVALIGDDEARYAEGTSYRTPTTKLFWSHTRRRRTTQSRANVPSKPSRTLCAR